MPKLFTSEVVLGQQGQGLTSEQAAVMKASFERKAKREGKTWNPENVSEAIINCRTNCNGVPLFRPSYAGEQLEVNGEPATLMVCWNGGKDCSGTFFKSVPDKEVQEMESREGEWKYFLRKWDTNNSLPTHLHSRIGEALRATIHRRNT